MLTGCYQRNKGKFQKETRKRYQNLSINIFASAINIFLKIKSKR